MGTRHLTCIVKDGVYKLAHYGQFDGYPSCAGIYLLETLRDHYNIDQLKAVVENITLVRGDVDISEDVRLTGYEVLGMLKDKGGHITDHNEREFGLNSLWCEFAYVIDLDAMTFESYRGCNTDPVSKDERFHGFCANGYYPVKLVLTHQLENLPTTKDYMAQWTEIFESEMGVVAKAKHDNIDAFFTELLNSG